MRKRTRRTVWLKVPPKGLRPLLPEAQQVDLNLLILGLVDQIAAGQAPVETMWDYARSVFTMSVMADMMDLGAPEMAEQLRCATRLIERWQRTGRVLFDGPDLQLARAGTEVMAAIAASVDEPTALAAVHRAVPLLRAACGPIGITPPTEESWTTPSARTN